MWNLPGRGNFVPEIGTLMRAGAKSDMGNTVVMFHGFLIYFIPSTVAITAVLTGKAK